MEEFLRLQLDGESGAEVVDLCLDHDLISELRPDKFEDIGGLQMFPNLEIFSAVKHVIADLSGLPELSSLHTLSLSLNEIESLQGFPNFPQLERLDLSHNMLQSLADLPALPQLIELNLGHNHLHAIAELPFFPALQTLVLSGNRRIKSLSGLEKFPALRSLFLKQCFVADWTGLAAAPQIRELSISPGNGGDLQVLEKLSGLESLHVAGSRLHGSWHLPAMPDLLQLEVRGGLQLQQITGWEGLPGLETLRLRSNSLQSVPDLGPCSNLRHLDLSHNPIHEAGAIEKLKNLEELVLEAVALPPKMVLDLQEKLPGVHVIW